MKVRNREEYWIGRTARKRHLCRSSAECCTARYIEPGDRYIELKLPPSAEFSGGEWCRLKACLPCASYFNRGLVTQLFPDQEVA